SSQQPRLGRLWEDPKAAVEKLGCRAAREDLEAQPGPPQRPNEVEAVILVVVELQATNPVVSFFRRRFRAAEHSRSDASSRIQRWRLPNPASQIGISNTRPCTALAPDFRHSLSILFQPRKIWQLALISNICPRTACAAGFPHS